MLFNSRGVALLLGISISLVTTAFLSLVEGVSPYALLVCLLLSFSSTYLLVSITLEFLVFREINKVYAMLNKIKRKDLSFIEKKRSKRSRNPFRQISQEMVDYAEHKQQEVNDLKKMAEFRREFVANVSHELKTPIFAAQGFVHTLLDGAVERKKFRYKFLKKAAKSLDGLDMLVQDLLTLSQMETGGIKMHYDHFDIQETITDVFEQLEEEAHKKEITLVLDSARDHTYVYADPHRIYQVIVNLVGNAIKYTKRGGASVTVSFTYEEETVGILVQDEGRGIPPEDIQRIFERFYRVEKSRSRNKGGTGLGLAIVKHIIEAHRSEVKVRSRVGEGSTFSFHLPVGQASEASPTEETTAEETADL